jgi:biopolymer transport protein ExbD
MKGSSDLAEPQLNATPLIDVLLVLIVMLIFTLPIATHAVKLNLPQGTNGPPPPAIRITIESDGTVYWDDTRMASLNALLPRLQEVASQQNPPLIRVMPDKRARYETVAQVLAAAQRMHVDLLTVMPVTDVS